MGKKKKKYIAPDIAFRNESTKIIKPKTYGKIKLTDAQRKHFEYLQNEANKKPTPVISQGKIKPKQYIKKGKSKAGEASERFGQVVSNTVGMLGMNVPFDAARTLGVDVPVSGWMPTALDYKPQSLKENLTKLGENTATAVATDMGFGLVQKGAIKALPYVKKGVESGVKEVGKRIEPYVFGEKPLPFNFKPAQFVVAPSKRIKYPGIKPGEGIQTTIPWKYSARSKIPEVDSQIKLWEKNGINTNWNDATIIKDMARRSAEIDAAPFKSYVKDVPSGTSRGNLYQYYKPKGKEAYKVGRLTYSKDYLNPGYLDISMVRNILEGSKTNLPKQSVTTPLGGSLLKKAHAENYAGFSSGKTLLRPDKTIPAIEKNFISKSGKETGVHFRETNADDYISEGYKNFGDDVGNSRFIEVAEYTKDHPNQPFKEAIYNRPTKLVEGVNPKSVEKMLPTKSIFSRHPGQKVDWSSNDIYKGIVPLGMVGTGYKLKKK